MDNAHTSSKSSARTFTFVVTAAVVVAAGVLTWTRLPGAASDPPLEPVPGEAGGTVPFLMEQQWLIRMKLAMASPTRLAPQIVSTGRVVPAPENHAFVAPAVAGVIGARRLPSLGQLVREGDVIAVLIQTPTAAESAQIAVEQARVESERRGLAEARTEALAQTELFRSEAARAERLFDAGAYSLRQLERARTDLAVAEAGLAAVEARLEGLARPPAPATYEVRAPITGTVVGVSKRFGDQVQAGEAILEIVNMGTVWVEAPIFERDLGRLDENPRAAFTTPTFPGREFTSDVLVDSGSVIDAETRAATFVFEAPNPDRALRIGMQTNIRLDANEEVDVLLIPREAVLDHEGADIVYVLLSGEEFQRRDVTLGDAYGGMVAVVSGLEPGERVVTQGAYQLKLQELQPADPGVHLH